uniref:Uncharacterized protein n=1 Tax=Chelonoidis abingdonii TaxID=106734 RepID=A0A8C0IQC5_CHEAB
RAGPAALCSHALGSCSRARALCSQRECTRASGTSGPSAATPATGILDQGLTGTSCNHLLLRSQALCVKDLALELPNCQLLSGAPSTIQCKADVTISLDPSDCNST